VAVSAVKILEGGAGAEEGIRGEIEWGVIVMDGSSPTWTLLISRDQSAAHRGEEGAAWVAGGVVRVGSAMATSSGSCGVGICIGLRGTGGSAGGSRGELESKVLRVGRRSRLPEVNGIDAMGMSISSSSEDTASR